MFAVKSSVSSAMDISWSAIHKNKEGVIISAQRKRGKWWLWAFGEMDTYRVKYCEAHRHDNIPDDFRTGKWSLKAILFFLKVQKWEPEE